MTELYLCDAPQSILEPLGEVTNWREAIEKSQARLNHAGSILVDVSDCECIGYFITTSVKSLKCPACGGVVHAVNMLDEFWCPACEPEGLSCNGGPPSFLFPVAI